MDVVLHPKSAENNWVHISCSKPGDGVATTAVACGLLDGIQLTEVDDVLHR